MDDDFHIPSEKETIKTSRKNKIRNPLCYRVAAAR